jgi:hypothetical protein
LPEWNVIAVKINTIMAFNVSEVNVNNMIPVRYRPGYRDAGYLLHHSGYHMATAFFYLQKMALYGLPQFHRCGFDPPIPDGQLPDREFPYDNFFTR